MLHCFFIHNKFHTRNNGKEKNLKALDREILHGNPSTPASDTEVVFHCIYLSCGVHDNAYE